MNTKQMILLEQLIQDFYNSQNKRYTIIFEINDQLYTGNFLKRDSDRCYYVEYYEYSTIGEATNFYKEGQTNKKFELIEDFHKALGSDTNGTRSRRELVGSRPYLILEAAIKVVSGINPDDYLNDSYSFPPVIYNFKNIITEKKLDFYMIQNEAIRPVSLVEEK